MNYKGVLNSYLGKRYFTSVSYSHTIEGEDQAPFYSATCVVVRNGMSVAKTSRVFSRRISAEQEAAEMICNHFCITDENWRGYVIEKLKKVDPSGKLVFLQNRVELTLHGKVVPFYHSKYPDEFALLCECSEIIKQSNKKRQRSAFDKRYVIFVDAENVIFNAEKCYEDPNVVYQVFTRTSHYLSRVNFDKDQNIILNVLNIPSTVKDAVDIHLAMTLAKINPSYYDEIYVVTKDHIGVTIAEVGKRLLGRNIIVSEDLPDLNKK